MSTLPHTGTVSGNYTAEFDGFVMLFLFGPGGGGGQGSSLVRGAGGGGGGACVVSVLPVVNGGVYPYTIEAPGAGATTQGGTGTNGGSTYWGDGLTYKAEGGKGGGVNGGEGGNSSGSLGDAVLFGTAGTNSVNGDGTGKSGGKAGGTTGGAGGAGGNAGGVNGSAGALPGGGGGGGGQVSDGGAGGGGMVYIIEAPDTKTGYHSLGRDADWVYDGVTVSDYTAEADGFIPCQAWGAGGGGKGGNGGALQGGSGGGGGGYSYRLVPVEEGDEFTRAITAGGAGGALNGSAGAAGGDCLIAGPNKGVTNKALTSNVATLTTGVPHGLAVSDKVYVQDLGSPFDGTYTVASTPTSTTFTYAKTNANVTSVAAVGRAGKVQVLAKGGLGATSATAEGAGGSTTGAVGSLTISGENGWPGYGAQLGGAIGNHGGTGGGPNGGLGGYGGGWTDNPATPVNSGQDGFAPGGGGGGGRAASNGNAGDGAQGGAVIQYFVSLGSVNINGVEKFIVRIRAKDSGGVVREITRSSIIQSGVRKTTKKVHEDAETTVRRKPLYIPAGAEGLFDVNTGRFNWEVGGVNTDAALHAATPYFVWTHVGDSVSDGSTALARNNPLDYTINYPTAYPRLTRALLATATGTSQSGTGLVRVGNIADADPQWTLSGWAKVAGEDHYVQSSNTGHTATMVSVVAGTAVSVTTIGAGVCSVTIDGVLQGTKTVAGASDAVTQTKVYTGLSNATHTVVVKPFTGTCKLVGADVYTPNVGIKVHNISQGGSRAALNPDSSPQSKVWGDTGAAAPKNMSKVYGQAGAYERRPHAVVIALAGNDSFLDTDADDIADAVELTGFQFDHPSTDIILYPDAHTGDRIGAMMQKCLDNDWAMIDFFWLSNNIRTIFGRDYNGDTYGHLNTTTGPDWMSNLLKVGLYGS